MTALPTRRIFLVHLAGAAAAVPVAAHAAGAPERADAEFLRLYDGGWAAQQEWDKAEDRGDDEAAARFQKRTYEFVDRIIDTPATAATGIALKLSIADCLSQEYDELLRLIVKERAIRAFDSAYADAKRIGEWPRQGGASWGRGCTACGRGQAWGAACPRGMRFPARR